MFSYQTGVEFPTEISLKPKPRIPSNFASKKVIPGSVVASMNSCGDMKTRKGVNSQEYSEICTWMNRFYLLLDNDITNFNIIIAKVTRNSTCPIADRRGFSCNDKDFYRQKLSANVSKDWR